MKDGVKGNRRESLEAPISAMPESENWTVRDFRASKSLTACAPDRQLNGRESVHFAERFRLRAFSTR
jgi:hypothetical protein